MNETARRCAVLPVFDDREPDESLGYRQFGKRPHGSGPNFGDCFACALSAPSGEPLLFKGNDFHHTDVTAA